MPTNCPTQDCAAPVSEPKGYADSLIAAIALSRGLTVVTRDTDDFPGVPTLNPFL